MRSRVDENICSMVGLATNWPSIRPMRTAAIGPFHGMSEMARAALAPFTIEMSDSLLLVGGEQDADDLHLVQEALGEERAAGAVAQAGGEDLLFGGAALALEIAAGEAAGSGVLLAIVDRQREEVLAGAQGRGGGGGDKDDGFADCDCDGPVGKLGQGTGGDGKSVFGNGDGMFLIHITVILRGGIRGGPLLRLGQGLAAAWDGNVGMEEMTDD